MDLLEVSGKGRRISKTLRTKEAQNTLQKSVAQIFRTEGEQVLAALEKQKSLFPEVKIFEADEQQQLSVVDEIISSVQLSLQGALVWSIFSGDEAAASVGIASTANLLSVEAAFGVENPLVQSWLTSHVAEMVAEINLTTKADIGLIVSSGYENNRTYNQIAKDIKSKYSEYAIGKPQQHIQSRAHLVAVTEIGNAYEQGSAMLVEEELIAAGLNVEKSWHHVGDARVSEGCELNGNDGWIDYHAAHSSGDMHPLRFPGCRCVELYRRDKSRR